MRCLFLIAMLFATLRAQDTLSLRSVVEQARTNDPAINVSSEQTRAAAAEINVARTAYLPRVDFLVQANRATRNNVFGMLLPNSVIAPISGPPLASNDTTSVFGSATGFLVSWEPFDFGQRRAQVALAQVGERRATAAEEVSRYQAAVSAANTYLTLLAAEQAVKAADAAVARAQVLLRIVAAQVAAELRPGADESRARAELAAAETQRIRAMQAVKLARAALLPYVGEGRLQWAAARGRLLDPAPAAGTSTGALHPRLTQQRVAIEQSQAARYLLARQLYPRFLLQGSLYARGTGARPDGSTGGVISGLGPNIHNWGLGFSMTFPLLEYRSIRERTAVESARERTENARYRQIQVELETERLKAQADYEAAQQIARQVPVQLEAAQAAERQATARYQAGLATIIEVAEAQRLVSQAEIDAALVSLALWQARLRQAAATGDLESFLKEAEQ